MDESNKNMGVGSLVFPTKGFLKGWAGFDINVGGTGEVQKVFDNDQSVGLVIKTTQIAPLSMYSWRRPRECIWVKVLSDMGVGWFMSSEVGILGLNEDGRLQ